LRCCHLRKDSQQDEILSAGVAMAQDTVRLGTKGAYPPINFINDAGAVAGFERAVGDELCKRAGVTCEWVTDEWDSIVPNLRSGNEDVIIAGMSITDEREEVIDFSQTYSPPAASAFVAATPDADVAAGVVSAQVSTIRAAHVADTGATLLEFATPEQTIAAVKTGAAAAVFADKDDLHPFVEGSRGALMFVGEDISCCSSWVSGRSSFTPANWAAPISRLLNIRVATGGFTTSSACLSFTLS
jgi:polar amino acid transport system substrate-binding protein